MAALASRPSMVAAKTWRNGGASISATRQRAAFSGSDTARLSRITASSDQGALADKRTVQGFCRHTTTARKHSGTRRSAVFQCRRTTGTRLGDGLLARVRRAGRPADRAVVHVQDPAADPRPVERVGDQPPARDAIALVPLQGLAHGGGERV